MAKLTSIDGSGDDMKGAVEHLKRTLSTTKEYIILLAELRKASYDAHVDRGFTSEEALELCKRPLDL